MLTPDGVGRVYLAAGYTDMRKSIDGLAVVVSAVLELDPVSPHWFVFCGRRRDRLKILHWDHNGFWLYYRRLERGRFVWPDAVRRARCASARGSCVGCSTGCGWRSAGRTAGCRRGW